MYRRFLRKEDYYGIITPKALSDITRDDDNALIIAEQAAEATVLDFLLTNYEIEQELNKGKYLLEYDRKITYPVGTHFRLNGEIYKVIKSINGYKMPADMEYWKEYEQILTEDEEANIPLYSQMFTYHPKDLVIWNNKIYECLNDNGYDFKDIRIPSVIAWEEKEDIEEWDSVPYYRWDVVKYQGKFYALVTEDEFDQMKTPLESDCWGLIGDYDEKLNEYVLSEIEYVAYKNKVYYPVMNPNSDIPQLDVNIVPNDPRNYNLKRHIVQLAVYELHKLISPNNVSSLRVNDYEHSIQWLRDAARLKINPQIPRKMDQTKQPLSDWQMATFQTDYDPYKNPWHV